MGAAIKFSPPEDDDRRIYPLVWLDSSVNTSEENINGQYSIRSAIDQLKTFDNVQKCEEYLRSLVKEERIILIVSGQLGREITPRIHQLRQVALIYVYCFDKSANESWAKQYKKIKDVVTNFPDLIGKIRLERSKRSQNEVSDPLSIAMYQAGAYEERFIYSQLLIDVLLRTKPPDKEKYKLILHCKEKYHRNEHELKLIEQFQDDYVSDQALVWYMKDSFLYRILNRTLRLQHLDSLFLFRAVLRDIRRALKANKCTSTIRVYRSQLMTKEEIDCIVNSLGSLISVNSFLSTSIQRDLALVFLKHSCASNDLERVLLEIDANPSYTPQKPFGFIKCNNPLRPTEEVVFTMGSIFRLMNVYQNSDGMWVVNLTLCPDNDLDIQEILKPFTTNQKHEQLNLLSTGHFLRKLGHIDQAEKFFARLLGEFFGNNPQTADCYYELGCIAMQKELYDLSSNWHQKSLEIKSQIYDENEISLADSYSSIGQIYMKKTDYKQALASYLRALNITMQVKGENHPDVAVCYTNIGGVYQKQENYSEALQCYEKAVSIRQQDASSDQPDLGISHNNLGIIYLCRGEYDLALNHYNIALKLLKTKLPSLHPEIAVSYCGLGLISEQKNQLELALSYYEKTAVIYRQALSPSDPDLIEIEQHIQNILSKLSKN